MNMAFEGAGRRRRTWEHFLLLVHTSFPTDFPPKPGETVIPIIVICWDWSPRTSKEVTEQGV